MWKKYIRVWKWVYFPCVEYIIILLLEKWKAKADCRVYIYLLTSNLIISKKMFMKSWFQFLFSQHNESMYVICQCHFRFNNFKLIKFVCFNTQFKNQYSFLQMLFKFIHWNKILDSFFSFDTKHNMSQHRKCQIKKKNVEIYRISMSSLSRVRNTWTSHLSW